MTLRSRRGATGVELLSAMLLANLVGAWGWDLDNDGQISSSPSAYATEGGSKPPTGAWTCDTEGGSSGSPLVTFDTVNTKPGQCTSKGGCTTGAETSAGFTATDDLWFVDGGSSHLVLTRDGTLHAAGDPDLTLAIVAADDPDHYTNPTASDAVHSGGADVHCMAMTAEEAADLQAETGLASCGGFSLQFTADNTRPGAQLTDDGTYNYSVRAERVGRSYTAPTTISSVLACIAYGEADGEVRSVTVLGLIGIGTNDEAGFMDYTDDDCL